MPPTTPMDTGATSGGRSAMVPMADESRAGDGTGGSWVAGPIEDIKTVGAGAERVPSPPVFPPTMGLGPRVE
jgi:hypothetical protein